MSVIETEPEIILPKPKIIEKIMNSSHKQNVNKLAAILGMKVAPIVQ